MVRKGQMEKKVETAILKGYIGFRSLGIKVLG